MKTKIAILGTLLCLSACNFTHNDKHLEPCGISMDNTIDVFVQSLCNSLEDYEIIDSIRYDEEGNRMTAKVTCKLSDMECVITINAAPQSKKVFLVIMDLCLEPSTNDSLLIHGYYGAVTGIMCAQEMFPNGADGIGNKFYYHDKYYESHGEQVFAAQEYFDLSIDDFYNAIFEKPYGTIWVRLLAQGKVISTIFSDKKNVDIYNKEIENMN